MGTQYIQLDVLWVAETELLQEPREEERKEDFRLGSSQLLIFTEGRLPLRQAGDRIVPMQEIHLSQPPGLDQ